MSRDLFTQPLRGIIVPMVTPLAGPDELDTPALERLVDHLVSNGVDGLFVLGTTGEGPNLSYRLRRELIEQTCSIAAERVAVLVGITDTSMAEALELGRDSGRLGASAVVAAPPYYLFCSQEELLVYFEKIAREVPIPLYLYNQPGNTKITIETATIVKALQIPNVAGIKNSSKDLISIQQVCRQLQNRDNLSVLIGPDGLMAEMVLMGADGGVNAGANIAPDLYVKLYQAARDKDLKKVHLYQKKVLQLIDTVYNVVPGKSRVIKTLKCALGLMGICNDQMTDPLTKPTKEEKNQIRKAIIDLGLMK